MSKLEELYQSIDTLKKLGVPINKEQLRALDEFEEELIKTVVKKLGRKPQFLEMNKAAVHLGMTLAAQ